MTRQKSELKANEFDSKLKRHPMSSEELQNVLCDFVEYLHIHDVSGSLPLPRCKCGQNALPYKAQIELDKCSRCGNDR
jgi:hypothetical protein